MTKRKQKITKIQEIRYRYLTVSTLDARTNSASLKISLKKAFIIYLDL